MESKENCNSFRQFVQDSSLPFDNAKKSLDKESFGRLPSLPAFLAVHTPPDLQKKTQRSCVKKIMPLTNDLDLNSRSNIL